MDTAAAKFVSSLVKSLQILCNGHLEFTDGLELVGHINVRIDKKLKFNCILDELVSKQKNDSTTFVSNSYHSMPPAKKNTEVPDDAYQPSDFMLVFPSTSSEHGFGHSKASEHILSSRETKINSDQGEDFSVAITKSAEDPGNSPAVKVEEGDSSEDGCVVLPPTSESPEGIMMDTNTRKGSVQDKDGPIGWNSDNLMEQNVSPQQSFSTPEAAGLRKAPKSRRCSSCPRAKDRKTKNRCYFCDRHVCKEHTITCCFPCKITFMSCSSGTSESQSCSCGMRIGLSTSPLEMVSHPKQEGEHS